MKIKAGKYTAFEVEFFAGSLILNRGHWSFILPSIAVTRFSCGLMLRFYAFIWNACVTVKKVEK